MVKLIVKLVKAVYVNAEDLWERLERWRDERKLEKEERERKDRQWF